MIFMDDLVEIYDYLYSNLEDVSFYKEIAYGIQFSVMDNTIRIFKSKKKGITLDLSQCRDENTASKVNEVYEKTLGKSENLKSVSYPFVTPPLVGSDEVGKGDFFAPIIVCAVYLDKEQYDRLYEIGVRDSKDLSDKRIKELAAKIKEVTKNYSIIKVSQKKYNEMYHETNNINIILAHAHSAAISHTYEKHEFKNVLVDKFGREKIIINNLSKYDLSINFQTKAESNIAVAAASILARDALLKVMKQMEDFYHMTFPLGANRIVISTGKIFVKKYGAKELEKVCKMHFKTVNEIL